MKSDLSLNDVLLMFDVREMNHDDFTSYADPTADYDYVHITQAEKDKARQLRKKFHDLEELRYVGANT